MTPAVALEPNGCPRQALFFPDNDGHLTIIGKLAWIKRQKTKLAEQPLQKPGNR